MDELENLPVGEENEAQSGSEGQTPAQPDNAKQPEPEFNLETDKRWNTSFQKDPAKVLKSYYSLEKEYLPTKQLLKENGYEDLESLKQSLAEYKEFKNPDAEYNKFLSYISPMLKDEKYTNELRNSLLKIQKQVDRDKYGSQLTDDELERIKAGEEAKAELEKLRFEMDTNKAKEEILSGLSKLEEEAKAQNLDFDKNAFLKYCSENDVPPKLYKMAFDAHLKGVIKDKTIRSTEETVLKRINANGSMVVGSGDKGGRASATDHINLDKSLDAILAGE